MHTELSQGDATSTSTYARRASQPTCRAPSARWRMRAILVLSLLLPVSLGGVGHAIEGQGVARLVHQINQMVHLLAAGLWLGGLVPLAWLLGRARFPSGTAWISLARDVVPRFSQMGYAAVAFLAATGALNTLLLVGSTHALVGTPYGRLLGLKILLFLAMVTVALFNRFRLLPRLRREAQASAAAAALACSVLFEQGLGFAILAVVSVLGMWPPAIHAGGHRSGGADLVVAHRPVDRERGEPARHEDPDDPSAVKLPAAKSIALHMPPVRPSFSTASPKASIAPTTRATMTEAAVIVKL